MQKKVYTVLELNKYIEAILRNEPELCNIQVQGEISNFKHHQNGHYYFTLKDASSAINCVMFSSRARLLKWRPTNGDTILASGRISAYVKSGTYQLYVDVLIRQGAGDLMHAFEELKIKLSKEGLFATDRKRPLPVNPQRLGIVTSPTGAAVRDIITVSRRRNKGIKLYLYPVKVQGNGATAEIAKGIQFFNKHKLVDVIIVGRGGGSIEDLWAFNEEETVRAVAASIIPTISAVGHDTDFTLCDFAADKRAATPSQAAELAVADVDGYKLRVDALLGRCEILMQKRLEKEAGKIRNLKSSWVFKEPERFFAAYGIRVNTARERLSDYMQFLIKNKKQDLALASARLSTLSPLAVLSRGYTVTQTYDSQLITSVDQVHWGEELLTKLLDGNIVSIVQSTERQISSEKNTEEHSI